jgi:hypothetical protein
MHAADLVDRIRQDEAPHVGYLAVVVSELRSFSFKAADGTRVNGAVFIDPVWRGMVHWHAVGNLDHDRARARKEFEARFAQMTDGAAIGRRFEDLEQKEAA